MWRERLFESRDTDSEFKQGHPCPAMGSNRGIHADVVVIKEQLSDQMVGHIRRDGSAKNSLEITAVRLIIK